MKTPFGMAYSPIEPSVYAETLDKLILLKDRMLPQDVWEFAKAKKSVVEKIGGNSSIAIGSIKKSLVMLFSTIDDACEYITRGSSNGDSAIKIAVWVNHKEKASGSSKKGKKNKSKTSDSAKVKTETKTRPVLEDMNLYDENFGRIRKNEEKKNPDVVSLIIGIGEYDRKTCHTCMVIIEHGKTNPVRVYYRGCPVCENMGLIPEPSLDKADDSQDHDESKVSKLTTALRLCGGCKQVGYCTPEHQKQHFVYHRKVCPWTQKGPTTL